MSHFYLGIDVAKAKLDCALRLPSGKFRAKVIPNSPEGFATLLAWLTAQKAESVHVCMEATGIYWEDVAQHLATAGLIVSVVNPAQIKAYGASRLTRSKTDTVDAKLIADFYPQGTSAPSANRRLGSPVARRKSRCAHWYYGWTPYKPCVPRKATACWWRGRRCARTFSST